MEHENGCMCLVCLPGGTVPPPNPPPAGDKEKRDYTRQVYQNLLAVVELLEIKSPLSITQKQIQRDLNLSKGVAHDICWNLCARGWAEDFGDGMVRLKKVCGEKELLIGKMVMRGIKDIYGFEI